MSNEAQKGPSAALTADDGAAGGVARGRDPHPAPTWSELPARRLKQVRGGPEMLEISLALESVTPVFGGAYRTREVDEVDVVRAPTIRGHLRFWWRTLCGHQYSSTADLWKAEGALWGHAGAGESGDVRGGQDDPQAGTSNQKGGRSRVEIWVSEKEPSDIVTDDPSMKDVSFYALWPARAERGKGIPAAHRREPGARFRLHLRCPREYEVTVRNVLRAWVLFGGYGGRTRRGLGSLTVVDAAGSWLPRELSRAALRELFEGLDMLAPRGRPAIDMPLLAGASLYARPAQGGTEATGLPAAKNAWVAALGWLRDFRQGYQDGEGKRAREPGSEGRPGRSNWPEPDKVRWLSTPKWGLPWAHEPRHNRTPAWPRAGFGLPIIGRFQQDSREKKDAKTSKKWHELSPPRTEPVDFELCWRREGLAPTRLASPLIVKALPLAGGRFVPCALWLHRAYPEGARVELKGVADSGAPFDRLRADGDASFFDPLGGTTPLRQAFLRWLKESGRALEVVL